ncbi:NUDIX hydrolase domain-like protein [Zychaea mexicana]|uniref:NUDIX hydrolase domain-like protein n=1 Tax=Zychaea mexicana TaxID=64656 RepID=UPI0022FEC038|nr:NUDIX hydrolase domain-like protein [Zychaea mexicana]KAI9497724.1 NUDIX hydrolase domain-like protein [Zychaea mexicana]
MSSSSTVRVGVGCFVKCVIDNNVKILIGTRKGSHGAGAWQLPGGHLEMNESFEECARREVLEETNMEIDDIAFLTATNDIMASEQKHYVTVFMQATAKDPSTLRVMEPHKLDGEWQWIEFKDLNQYAPLFTPLTNLLKSTQHNVISEALSSI